MRSRSDKTTRVIVEAAKKLFLESGYNETTLDHIAKEAGTTKKTIYGYFENKKTLFLEVIEYVVGMPWVFQNPVKEITTGEELYLVLYSVAKGLNDLYSRPEYEQLIRTAISEVTHSPEINTILDRGITRRSLKLVITIMETASERGIVEIRNPEFRARSFISGMLVGFYSEGLLTPHPFVPRPYSSEELMEYVATCMPLLTEAILVSK